MRLPAKHFCFGSIPNTASVVKLHGVMAIILDFGSNDSGSTPGEAIALFGQKIPHMTPSNSSPLYLIGGVQSYYFIDCTIISLVCYLSNNNKLVQSFLGNNSGLIYYFFYW